MRLWALLPGRGPANLSAQSHSRGGEELVCPPGELGKAPRPRAGTTLNSEGESFSISATVPVFAFLGLLNSVNKVLSSSLRPAIAQGARITPKTKQTHPCSL